MEISFKGESLRYYEKTLHAPVVREDAQELIVPDARPDVAEILLADGQSCLRGKDLRSGGVAVTGLSELTVLYHTSEGGLEKLEADVPFEAEFSLSEAGDADRIIAEVRLVSAEARMLNSRKLIVRAEVCVTASVWSPRELSWAADAVCEGCHAELLREKKSIWPVVQVEEKTFAAEEEVPVPAGKSAPEAVLFARAILNREGCEAVGSRLVVRGSAEVTAVYRGSDGIPAQALLRLPWSAFLELPEDGQQLRWELTCALTGCSVTTAAGGGFAVSVGGVAQCALRKRNELAFVTDAYGTDCALLPAFAEARLPLEAAEIQTGDTLELRLGGLKRPRSLLCVTADCSRPRGEKEGVRLPVAVKALCLMEDGELECLRGSGEAESPDCSSLPEVSAGEPYAGVTPAGVEVRVPVSFRQTVVQTETLRFLTGAEVRERDGSHGPAVTLVVAARGDSVWSLCKARGLPCEAIRCYNQLGPGEEPAPGTLLLLAR